MELKTVVGRVGCWEDLARGGAEGAEVLLKNDLTCFGLRRVHVVSDRKVADWRRWLRTAGMPFEAEGSLAVWQYEDAAVRFWHLWMVWHVRGEVVGVQCGGVKLCGVLWYVEPGETMGKVIEDAAMRFWLYFDRQPAVAWAASLQKGAPDHVELEAGNGKVWIDVRAAGWAPKRCVFVCGSEGRDVSF